MFYSFAKTVSKWPTFFLGHDPLFPHAFPHIQQMDQTHFLFIDLCMHVVAYGCLANFRSLFPFLNQACSGLWLVHAWFICPQTSECLCVSNPEGINQTEHSIYQMAMVSMHNYKTRSLLDILSTSYSYSKLISLVCMAHITRQSVMTRQTRLN